MMINFLLICHRLKWLRGRARFDSTAFLRSLLCIVAPPSTRTLLPISNASEIPVHNPRLAYDTPQRLRAHVFRKLHSRRRVSRPRPASWRTFSVGETICVSYRVDDEDRNEGGTRSHERRPDSPDGRELTGLAEGSYPYRYTMMGRAHVPHRRWCRATLRIRPARRAKGTRRLVGGRGERTATSRGESRSLGRKVTVIRAAVHAGRESEAHRSSDAAPPPSAVKMLFDVSCEFSPHSYYLWLYQINNWQKMYWECLTEIEHWFARARAR